jgi:hypothetical protein
MGYNIADFYAGQLRRASCHKLPDNDSAVSPGNSVNADAAEILRLGVRSSGKRGLENQDDCDYKKFHGQNIAKSTVQVNSRRTDTKL